MAEALGQSEHEVWRVRLAARLHDVGKTAIPAGILAKPGPLDEGEWEFMHRHPLIGERIVLAAPALAGTAPLIRSSHERVDGRGYPDGLVGEAIPLGARIIAVCDAFDAMTSERPYRGPMNVAGALEELKQARRHPVRRDGRRGVLQCGLARFRPAVAAQTGKLDSSHVLPPGREV